MEILEKIHGNFKNCLSSILFFTFIFRFFLNKKTLIISEILLKNKSTATAIILLKTTLFDSDKKKQMKIVGLYLRLNKY
jgi:hypothetical protein